MEVGLELCNVELCAVDKMYLFCVRFQIFSSEQSSVGIAFFDICWARCRNTHSTHHHHTSFQEQKLRSFDQISR